MTSFMAMLCACLIERGKDSFSCKFALSKTPWGEQPRRRVTVGRINVRPVGDDAVVCRSGFSETPKEEM